MSSFKYEQTQVLTLIYQANKENIITDEEKKIMKEHIISTEPDLTVEMEKYNKDKDISSFIETLKLRVGLTTMSSPLDTNLLKIKKHRGKKRGAEEKKVEIKEEDIGLNECELGNSPLIMPKTTKKTKQK